MRKIDTWVAVLASGVLAMGTYAMGNENGEKAPLDETYRVVELRRNPNDLDALRYVVRADLADDFATRWKRNQPNVVIRHCAPFARGNFAYTIEIAPAVPNESACTTIE